MVIGHLHRYHRCLSTDPDIRHLSAADRPRPLVIPEVPKTMNPCFIYMAGASWLCDSDPTMMGNSAVASTEVVVMIVRYADIERF